MSGHAERKEDKFEVGYMSTSNHELDSLGLLKQSEGVMEQEWDSIYEVSTPRAQKRGGVLLQLIYYGQGCINVENPQTFLTT